MSDFDPYDLEQQEQNGDRLRSASVLASENADADFEWLMSGPRGRRIVRGLLSTAGVFRPSFQPNAMQMAHLEGAKTVGYWLLEQCERLCPSEYHTMMQEKQNGRRTVDHRSDNNN